MIGADFGDATMNESGYPMQVKLWNRGEALEEAKIWANNDPYLKSGVYENSEVSPFKKVLP